MTGKTFGSLFSGIGGLDLGLERAGWECKWQVEIDDYATKVLEKHWPGVPWWRDVAGFVADAEKQGQHGVQGQNGREEAVAGLDQLRVDLVCGGFPCQPVSLAGRRGGDRDERWLWPLYREVVTILRPRFVLVENVPGLLSADAGRLFGNILGDLAELGYDAEWGRIPAAALGYPHLRWRVFVVAYLPLQRRGARGSEPAREQGGAVADDGGPAAAERDEPGPQERDGNARWQVCLQPDPAPDQHRWRTVEPLLRRGADGLSRKLVPNRVDRIRCLGNAVVPAVAEWIGRRILEFERERKWETD